MKRRMLIGLIALVPAALNAAPARAGALALPVCTGDGSARTITVPVPTGELPGRDQPGCCAAKCISTGWWWAKGQGCSFSSD